MSRSREGASRHKHPLALFGVGIGAERTLGAWMAAVLAVVAFAAVAAPAALADAEADSLDHAIRRGPESGRRMAVRVVDDFRVGVNDTDLTEVGERLAEIGGEFDAELLRRFAPPRLVADSTRFRVDAVDVVATDDPTVEFPTPELPTYLTFRVMPLLADHSTLVAGRRATRTRDRIGDVAVFEIELATETAEVLEWELGDQATLTVDAADPLTRQFAGSLPPVFAVRVVGIVALSEREDPFWFGDFRLHRPVVNDTAVGADIFAFAAINADQLGGRPFATAQRSPMLVEQRFDLLPGAIDRDNSATTLAATTALEAAFADQPSPNRPGVATGLGRLLAIEHAQRQTARTTLTVATAGVVGIALATISVITAAALVRRRGLLVVARARGATAAQAIASAAAEMTMLAVPVVAAATGAAALVTSTVPERSQILTALAIAGGAVVVAGLCAAAESARAVTLSERAGVTRRRRGWTTLAALAFVLCAASIVTFRRRGIATAAPQVDLLVVVLPVLVPLAASAPAQRLVRWGLTRVARRGVALGSGRLVGLRRGADPSAPLFGVVTLLALALSLAGLGVAVYDGLGHGAVDASWRAVGAPYRIDTRDPQVADALRALPGVTLAASGSTRISVDRGEGGVNLQLFTLDVGTHRRITAGTVADLDLPAALETADAGRIPVVAASTINGERVDIGEVLVGFGNRSGQDFVVVETRATGFGRRDGWIAADRSVVGQIAGSRPTFNTLAVDGPDRQAIEAVAAGAGESVHVRSALLDAQLADPLSRAVRVGYLIAAGLGVLIALTGLATAVIASARQRTRDVTILGLLGAGRREIVRAISSEVLPAAVFAVLLGSATGWGVVELFDGRYDLRAFADDSPTSLRVAVLGAAVVAAVATIACIALVIGLARRATTTDVAGLLRSDGVR